MKSILELPEKYDKLIVSLKTAVVNEYTLDKESTSTMIFLMLRLVLRCYKIQ